MSATTTETMDVSLLTTEEIAAINAEASPDELVVMRQHREERWGQVLFFAYQMHTKS